MISSLARNLAIALALIAIFGVLKGFYDVGESYIDFVSIGIVNGALIFFMTLLVCGLLAISHDLRRRHPRDLGGGFGR